MTKEELLQKLTLVAMDHADITTLDKPIIGTHSLAPCLGILLYDEKKENGPRCSCQIRKPNSCFR